MSPMSLLTLPADTMRETWLREAEGHAPRAGSQGEPGERTLVLSVVLVLMSAGVALVLAG